MPSSSFRMTALVAAVLLCSCDSKRIEGPGGLLIPVCVDDVCGVVDGAGHIVRDFSSGQWLDLANPRRSYIASKDGKFGLRGRGDVELIPSAYDAMAYLGDDLFSVEKAGKWGVVDQTGRTILPLEYDDVWYYATLKVLQATDAKGGYPVFSAKGQRYEDVEAIGPVQSMDDFEGYEYGTGFDHCMVVDTHGGSYYKDVVTGKTSKTYPILVPPENGFVVAIDSDGRRNVINEQLDEVFPSFLEWVAPAGGGWFAFRQDGRYGYMDAQGSVVVPARFANVLGVGAMGAVVAIQDPKDAGELRYGIINRAGEWRIAPSLKLPEEGYTLLKPRVPLESPAGDVGVWDLDKMAWAVPPRFRHVSTDGRLIYVSDERGANDPFGVLYRKDGTYASAFYGLLLDLSATDFGDRGYMTSIGSDGRAKLISPAGKVIAEGMPKYRFVEPGLILGGYEENGVFVWLAAFDASGKLLLVRNIQAKTLSDGGGRRVWPRPG